MRPTLSFIYIYIYIYIFIRVCRIERAEIIGLGKGARIKTVVDRVIDVASDLKIDQDKVVDFVEPARY